MKKILLTALTALSIKTVIAVAGERPDQGPDIYNPNNYKVEYDVKSQLTLLLPNYFKQVEEYDSIHDLTYMKNEFYDGITGQKIDLLFETIYMDDQDNRWYFPYDSTKSHVHK